jgi:hypothetical protein
LNERQGLSPAAVSSIVVAITPIIAVVVIMMLVVMLVPAISIPGRYNDPRSSPIIAVMVMMVVVMLYKELGRLHNASAWVFVDSLQLFRGIRNRF